MLFVARHIPRTLIAVFVFTQVCDGHVNIKASVCRLYFLQLGLRQTSNSGIFNSFYGQKEVSLTDCDPRR